MKINFDSLSRDETQRSSQEYLLNSFSFDSIPNKQQLSTYSMLTQDTNFKTNHPVKKNAEEVKKFLQFHLEQALRKEDKKDQIFISRKRKSIDLKELTDRIYQSPSCNKKHCKRLQLQKTNRELMEFFQTSKQFKANRKYTQYDEEELSVFERLHNYSKIKAAKQLQRDIIYIQPQKQIQSRAKKAYLKNYIPFYKRLQSIVSKSQEKKQFLQNNPQLSFSSQQIFFAPTLYKSKYDIKSRYSKDISNSKNGVSYKDLTSSLNTSFQSISSLDKSVQMVCDIQQYFFNRMECIFVDREEGRIEISEENVKLLSSVEFKIMQDFIIGLQKTPITPQLFVDKLEAYYQKLNFRDKQQLRTHQSKLKKYSRRAKKQQASNSTLKLAKVEKICKKEGDKNGKYFQKQLLYV